MEETVVKSPTREVRIGPERSFVLIGERINPTGRKKLSEELAAGGLRIISGGTDCHLVLADVRPLESTGKGAEETLAKVGIIVNPNAIPFDTRPPRIASGIRLGTPAVTSRGFGDEDVRYLGRLILRALRAPEDATVLQEVAQEAEALAFSFPVPGLDD